MTNKMTYVSAIDFAINAVQGNDEVVERLTALKSALEKRNARKATGMTKVQKENVAVKESIKGVLAESENMTATEVANAVGISLAKATALLTQMVKAGEINRTVEKKVAHFSM